MSTRKLFAPLAFSLMCALGLTSGVANAAPTPAPLIHVYPGMSIVIPSIGQKCSLTAPCRGEGFEQKLAAIPRLPARPKAPSNNYRARLEKVIPQCRLEGAPQLFPDDIEEFKKAHTD